MKSEGSASFGLTMKSIRHLRIVDMRPDSTGGGLKRFVQIKDHGNKFWQSYQDKRTYVKNLLKKKITEMRVNRSIEIAKNIFCGRKN